MSREKGWRYLLPFIDLLLEVADARLPRGSRNAGLLAGLQGKARVLLLNKADLADPKLTRAWQNHFMTCEGVPVIPLEALSGNGMARLKGLLRAMATERGKQRHRGPVRAVAVGIPNVGKSTVINRLVGRGVAATGAVPGITKGKQWLRLAPGLELLDTPGHLTLRRDVPLWQLVAIRATAANKDEAGQAAEELLNGLAGRYGKQIAAYYGVEGEVTLQAVAQRRGFLAQKGAPDLVRAASAVLGDFWRGRWGKITLEEPRQHNVGETADG